MHPCFVLLCMEDIPSGLLGRIMGRIRRERLRIAKRDVIFFSVGVLASLGVFIPVFYLIRADLFRSGFLQIITLPFSDPAIVRMVWKDFSMAVLESFPAAGISMILITFLIFLGSLKFLARGAAIIFARL